MAVIIQTRHDTAANFTSANTLLADGELAIETDTLKIKMGDGITAWNSLAYIPTGGDVESVNGQTGVVELDAEDVGALPNSTVIPTDTADLTNGAGFITSSALSGYATEQWVGQQGYLTGISSSDVTTALGYTPYNSSNPDGFITSSALTGYEQKATVQTLSATDSITLADNTIYSGSEQTALTIALPATVDVSFICEIDFTSGTTATTLAYPNTIKWLGDDVANNIFIPAASKRYTIIVAYDGVNYRATVKGV